MLTKVKKSVRVVEEVKGGVIREGRGRAAVRFLWSIYSGQSSGHSQWHCVQVKGQLEAKEMSLFLPFCAQVQTSRKKTDYTKVSYTSLTTVLRKFIL